MTYAPKPGSKAEAMVAALQRSTWLTTEKLARAGNASNAHVHGLMATAIKHGAVAKDMIEGQLRWRWTPPAASPTPWPFPLSTVDAEAAPQEQTTGPAPGGIENSPEDSFACALWSDGDLEIFGALEIEQNGVPGVRLNRDQAEQLLRLLVADC